jgi:hypothetical protein
VTLVLVALLAGAVPQSAFDRTRDALASGDTVAAVRALAAMARVSVPPPDRRGAPPVEPRISRDALSGLLLLQWIARSPTQRDARNRWESETELLGTEHDMSSDVAVDVAFLARWLERGHPARSSDAEAAREESWKRLLRVRRAAQFATDPVAAGWARVVLAQWDLTWLDHRLFFVPPRTVDTWRCPASPYGWCAVRDPGWSPGQVGRLVEADTLLEPVLRRLKLDLHDAAAGPWPLSEIALRMRIGLQLALYPRSPDPMIDDRVRTADLPEGTRAELLAMLAQFAGRPRLADSLMQAHAARFAPLDRELGTFSTGELSPAAFWVAAWPIYLEPYNARLLTHRARLLLADQLDRMIPGDGGFGLYPGRTGVVLRGMPEMVFRLRDTVALSWAAGEVRRAADFVEIVDPAMHETILPMGRRRTELPALDLALAARGDERGVSSSGFVAAGYDVMRHLDHQVVRLVRDTTAWLEFYTERPDVCAAARPVLGFFLLDDRFRIVRRHVDSAAAWRRRFRLRVPADSGTHLYSLELVDPSCHWAARARYVTSVAHPAAADMSDLVLAERLEIAEAARVAGDMPITPRYGLLLAPGDLVHIYWEVYGVDVREDQRDRLAVAVQVVDVLKRPVAVGLLGRVARTARDRRPALDTEYDVTVPAGSGPLGMSISLGLPADAEGVYVARISVTDRQTKRTLTAERAFRVAPAR